MRVTEEKQNDSREICCFLLFFFGFCWVLLMCVKGIPSFSELEQNMHSKDRPGAGRSMLRGFNLCGRALCSSGAGVLSASGDRGCGRDRGQFLAATVAATGTATPSVLALQVVVACYVKGIGAVFNAGKLEAYNVKLVQELWQSLILFRV